MDKFNPFRDLAPPDRDRAIEQLGGATENNLQQLQFRLKFTSEYTKQFLNVIKDKNKSFNRDLERIKVLDERLKREIPVIPMMGGIAGNVFGEEGYEPGPFTGFPGFPFDLPGRIPRRPRTPTPQPAPVPQEQPQTTNITEMIRRLLALGYTLDQIRKILQGVFVGAPAMADEIDDALAEEFVRKQNEDQKKLIPLRKLPVRAPEPDLLTKEQFKLSLKAEDALAKGASPAFLNDSYAYLNQYFAKTGKSGAVKTPDGGLLTVRPVGLFEKKPEFNYIPGRKFVEAQKSVAEASKYAALIRIVTDVMGAGAGARRPQIVPQQPTTIPSVPPKKPEIRVIPPETVPVPVPTRPRKTGETSLSPTKVKEFLKGRKFGPDKLSSEQIQGTLDVLRDPSLARQIAPPGTIANFLGLNSPSIRNQFLDYLTGARSTKQGLPNYGLYEKILRQIGLIQGSTPPKQVDDDVFRFLMNYHIKYKISPDNLIQQLLRNQMIDPSTIGNPNIRNKMDEAIKKGKETDPFLQLKPFKEQYDYNLQSLNIDTDVETLIVVMKPRFVSSKA